MKGNSGVKQTSGTTAASSTISAPTTTKRSTCIIETNINYPGNDLMGVGNLTSASDCCNYCGSTVGCAGWSYFISYSYCFLKASVPIAANREAYTGIISGFLSSA